VVKYGVDMPIILTWLGPLTIGFVWSCVELKPSYNLQSSIYLFIRMAVSDCCISSFGKGLNKSYQIFEIPSPWSRNGS